jgi:hypothetical protein
MDFKKFKPRRLPFVSHQAVNDSSPQRKKIYALREPSAARITTRLKTRKGSRWGVCSSATTEEASAN